MDSMEIQTTSIHIYRQAIPLLPATLAEKKRYVILEPIEFMARINRNISTSSELYPNVDIVLEMDSIQVCSKIVTSAYVVHEKSARTKKIIGWPVKFLLDDLLNFYWMTC